MIIVNLLHECVKYGTIKIIEKENYILANVKIISFIYLFFSSFFTLCGTVR